MMSSAVDGFKGGVIADSRTDSGFLSGNLVNSGSGELLASEEFEEKMRIDSGMDLGERLSMVRLENEGYNDLSSRKKGSRTTGEEEERLPWELYFGQDEEGDT